MQNINKVLDSHVFLLHYNSIMLVSTSMLIFCLIWNENYRAYSVYINSPNCITEPTTAPARAPKLTAEVKAALEMESKTVAIFN